MHFQWYPGHMTKAKRMMQENIKLIDLVIELVDARIPISSRNPDIDELGKNKARLVLLNKADLAEDKWNDAWAEYFKAKGYSVVKVNSKKGGGIKSIQGVILGTYYPDVLPEKYAVEPDEDPYVVLHQIAKNRNCVVRGNELNTEKAAMLLLDDFRNGRLGRLTLEYPEGVC